MHNDDPSKRAASNATRGTIRILVFLLKLFAPLAPIIIALVLILGFLTMMVGAVNSSMPENKDLNYDAVHTIADEEREQEYIRLTDEANIRETWEVSGEGDTSKDTHIGYLADEYGKDQKLKMEWGMLHSVSQMWTFVFNMEDIDPEMPERVARELGPVFWYKQSTITVTSCNDKGECDTDTRDIKLLVEADTYLGHYKYNYKWETETYGNTTVTKEVLDKTETVSLWERLDTYLARLYQTDEKIDLTRLHVLETGKGYTQAKEWLDYWQGDVAPFKGIASGIPEEMKPLFEEAEELYGVPAYVLAAIAFFESGFNPLAINEETGALGLMQILPMNWKTYGEGGDPFDAKDNIMAAARMLKQLGWGKIDPLAILAQYEGDPKSQEAQNNAKKVWELAMEYKASWDIEGYVFPVKGHSCKNISSHYTSNRDGKPHYAVDIAAPEGTPILAFIGGTVEFKGWDVNGGGKTIKILGQDGRKQVYCHLVEYAINNGERVDTGSVIGYVGNTGNSRGNNLHFAIKDIDGNPINPEPYLMKATLIP